MNSAQSQTQPQFNLSHLDRLESESIYIMREVAATFERPVFMYSIGKDSSVLLRLAQKAFSPGKIPFPLLHVDTGFKFPEMYEFRDRLRDELGFDLIVWRNEDAIKNNTNPYDLGTQRCCALLKTGALLDALKSGRYDAAIGGARRDEEKSRAKERFYSFRDRHGQWNPKIQRPELWNAYNGSVHQGESIRVFPLSNWTELDVWLYIYKEKIPINQLYFARERSVLDVNDTLIPLLKTSRVTGDGKPVTVMSRFRSLGCHPCTGAIRSNATTIEDILAEIISVRTSERASRVIDHDSDASMEKKKREGYF